MYGFDWNDCQSFKNAMTCPIALTLLLIGEFVWEGGEDERTKKDFVRFGKGQRD